MSNFSKQFCDRSPLKKEPEYRNIIKEENGKFTLSEPVDKKDWDKKSGQVQKYKKGTDIPKSTVFRSKYGTEREHELGKWRYEKNEEGRKLFRI